MPRPMTGRARSGRTALAPARTARPTAVLPGDPLHGRVLDIPHARSCTCPPNHLNCLTAKEWLKCQVGVWRFGYERRDVRDKSVHPATFPISLARQAIELFTHRGELVLDPFVGSGTTLVAARDARRSAVGLDLQERIREAVRRAPLARGRGAAWHLAARHPGRSGAGGRPHRPGDGRARAHLPSYANLLNRRRRNKSRRDRRNPSSAASSSTRRTRATWGRWTSRGTRARSATCSRPPRPCSGPARTAS